MSYSEFLYAVQLIAEERHGKHARLQLRAENAQAMKNTENLKRASHGLPS